MRREWTLVTALILAAATPSFAGADSESAGGIYRLDWWTVDGGGGIRSDGAGPTPYHVGGTVGQPDAYSMTGGAYRLRGGFWSGREQLGTTDTPALPAARPSVFRAVPPWPNPARGAASLAVELPDERELSVQIFDVAGHRVRELASGRFGAGRQAFRWDGRDDSGRPVAAGLFFVHVDAGREHGVSKLVLLAPEGGAR